MLAQVDSEQLNLKDSSKRPIRVPQKWTQLNIKWAATCLGLFLWILLSFPSHPQPAYYPIRSQSLVRRIKVTRQHNRLLDSRSVSSDTHWDLNSEHKAWSGLGPLTRVDSTLHSKNRQLGRKSQGPSVPVPWPDKIQGCVRKSVRCKNAKPNVGINESWFAVAPPEGIRWKVNTDRTKQSKSFVKN